MMKHPMGPATSATPMPPITARVKKSSSIDPVLTCGLFGRAGQIIAICPVAGCCVNMPDTAIRKVFVIMLVFRPIRRGVRTEQ